MDTFLKWKIVVGQRFTSGHRTVEQEDRNIMEEPIDGLHEKKKYGRRYGRGYLGRMGVYEGLLSVSILIIIIIIIIIIIMMIIIPISLNFILNCLLVSSERGIFFCRLEVKILESVPISWIQTAWYLRFNVPILVKKNPHFGGSNTILPFANNLGSYMGTFSDILSICY